MRKTAFLASTLVLGIAGTAAADHQLVDTNGDGYADTTIDSTYDNGYYDDSYYDESTYPTAQTYGDWIEPATAIPAPQVVSVRARPGFVWVEGYWRWTGYDWSWVNGYWLRERPNYLYVQGRWDVNRGRQRWVSGYWKARPRVIIRDHRDNRRHWDRGHDHRRNDRGWGRGHRGHDHDRRVGDRGGRRGGGRDHRRGGWR
jgi:hypothetical protein